MSGFLLKFWNLLKPQAGKAVAFVVGAAASAFGAALSFTAYKYGRLVEKNEQSEKEKKSLEEVRRLRDGLSCADVVERVRRKFKR